MAEKRNGIRVTATGDSMITRSIVEKANFEKLREIIQKGDARFTNCEVLFHNADSYPIFKDSWPNATMSYAEKPIARELSNLGFNMVSLCNNHTMDYGPPGMFSTIDALAQVGIVSAGSGRDLAEARETRYIETDKGRVALIAACWSPAQQMWESASNTQSGIPARPGVNLLLVNTTYIVNGELLNNLRKTISVLGLNPPNGRDPHLGKDEISIFGHKFKEGHPERIIRSVRKKDMEDVIKTIKDAKKSADWVLYSFHTHDSDARGIEYPAMWVQEFARACIDAGADMYIGHGPHVLQGIEIYNKKPIFYSLGNFIVQNLTVKKVTYDQYRYYDLDDNSKPSDFYSARAGQIPPSGKPYDRLWFESIIPIIEIRKGLRIDLYPVVIGSEDGNPLHKDFPRLADKSRGKTIIEHLQTISRQWNTRITIQDGTGRILID